MSQSQDFPDAFYRVSVKALIRKGTTFMLGLEKESQHWESFGGGLDFGEDAPTALVREITEESGCSVISIAKQPLLIIPNRVTGHRNMEWFYTLMCYYPAEVDFSTFDPGLQFSEYKFFTLEEIQTLPLFIGEEGIRAGFKSLFT
jgi:8-oxo-dGTP pyrophosphatase MutT (NUDIX family)